MSKRSAAESSGGGKRLKAVQPVVDEDRQKRLAIIRQNNQNNGCTDDVDALDAECDEITSRWLSSEDEEEDPDVSEWVEFIDACFDLEKDNLCREQMEKYISRMAKKTIASIVYNSMRDIVSRGEFFDDRDATYFTMLWKYTVDVPNEQFAKILKIAKAKQQLNDNRLQWEKVVLQPLQIEFDRRTTKFKREHMVSTSGYLPTHLPSEVLQILEEFDAGPSSTPASSASTTASVHHLRLRL